jgi:hypothetical protein
MIGTGLTNARQFSGPHSGASRKSTSTTGSGRPAVGIDLPVIERRRPGRPAAALELAADDFEMVALLRVVAEATSVPDR